MRPHTGVDCDGEIDVGKDLLVEVELELEAKYKLSGLIPPDLTPGSVLPMASLAPAL